MLVLDTNVISEVLRPEPDRRVKAWLKGLPSASVFTTAIAQAEILYGINILPQGRRRTSLLIAAVSMFDEDFQGRVLPFDATAATAYASLASEKRQQGLPMAFADAQIAAITLSRDGRLATRNVRDFVGCGIDVLNPWDA